MAAVIVHFVLQEPDYVQVQAVIPPIAEIEIPKPVISSAIEEEEKKAELIDEEEVLAALQDLHTSRLEAQELAKKEIEITKEIKPPVREDIFMKPSIKGPPYKIAIIIDDMGMDRKRGFELIEMDAALTLAFLPYAPSLDDITQAAQENGHELMIHMPMQPINSKVSLGGIGLVEGMSGERVEEELLKAFESFDGYVGLNNHMGSRVTQNEQIMRTVMEQLKERDLYFVDSKTISTSVAGMIAREEGLRNVDRDVFLDHENTIGFVRQALKNAERVAQRQGYAVLIGHPKDVTIQGLKEWLPTLAEKNIELVPASALTHVYGETDKVLAHKDVQNIEPAASDDEKNTLEIDPNPGLYGLPQSSFQLRE